MLRLSNTLLKTGEILIRTSHKKWPKRKLIIECLATSRSIVKWIERELWSQAYPSMNLIMTTSWCGFWVSDLTSRNLFPHLYKGIIIEPLKELLQRIKLNIISAYHNAQHVVSYKFSSVIIMSL